MVIAATSTNPNMFTPRIIYKEGSILTGPTTFQYNILNPVAQTIVDPWTCAKGGYFRINITAGASPVPSPTPTASPPPSAASGIRATMFAVVAIFAAVLALF
jgi:hypothetical protein